MIYLKTYNLSILNKKIPYNGALDDMEQGDGGLGQDDKLALDDMGLEHMVVDELNTQLQ